MPKSNLRLYQKFIGTCCLFAKFREVIQRKQEQAPFLRDSPYFQVGLNTSKHKISKVSQNESRHKAKRL